MNFHLHAAENKNLNATLFQLGFFQNKQEIHKTCLKRPGQTQLGDNQNSRFGFVFSSVRRPPFSLSVLLAGTLPTDVADTAALVAGLRPRVGAVLHNVPNLIAVVAGVLVLAAVPGDVAGAVTLIAAVLLLPALPGEVAKPAEAFGVVSRDAHGIAMRH